MSINRIKLSIVVPIYYNELNIPHTIPRLQNLEKIIPNCDFEFVFVDDGSKDNSFSLLMDAKEKDPRIKVIKLSRNFGSMAAIQAGLKYTTGDCVGIIAADLQDPPEMFEEMLEHWRTGKKVVLGTRADREESLSQKMFSNTYYFLLEKFALKGYPKGGFDFLLIDKQVVQEVLEIQEKNTNIMSLIYWLGHDQVQIPYVRQERKLGKSRWTLSKKIKLFVDSFVSFSYTPIRFMSFIGFATALLSFLYGVFVIFSTVFGIIELQGWTTIIALITFLLGIIMIMLGIIGEYLWRILDESRERPSYVVDQTFE
ncbi:MULTISPECIES: glycosyltransferase family 2 protein [Paenibacillus]|uniref:glycosyltransferase family 2 protein n=1 Tax=Paenibacillus TaxID=44249 RepID=UPI00096FF45F|nr:glycosyltransferase family 2 protein [Paenibacillus odorifer]OMD12205.1 glycosyltransferase [Paenibacillus odorifer]OMD25553.1 glycosyltransferase [Paenibacillus odorifer]OMD81301.1 glycosyltransferase [Paenibacillus odorifer]OMD83082.1 glycosyltransferase [Paenibacillus odorifer]OME02331.1 glycosyltransferase [Paenibacillus odorifer]